tara:strand:- start:2017 stop:3288 length:1272 start_codon:yes stop_codon:yes gene_type:complete
MNRRIIFIVIENFNREYSGKKLLAEELSSKGYTVFLGHKSILRTLIKLNPLKDQIYIEKGLTLGSGERIKKAKKSGMIIFSFDEEALMQTDPDNYSRFNHEMDSMENIDGIFSWGPKHSKLLKKIGYKEKKIIRTGNPRFDIYKIKSNISVQKKLKKYILICSRFCIERGAEIFNHNYRFIKPLEDIYEKLLYLPKFLRDSNIDNPILIRPHPSEKTEQWFEATDGLKNILISSDGPVANTFEKSLMMIHNRCTTGIEAFISNLPVISYEPIKLEEPPHPPSEFINSFANAIVTKDSELISNINNILENKTSSSVNLMSAVNYLYSPEKLSYKEISRFLVGCYPPIKNNLSKTSFLKIYLIIFIIYIYHKFQKIKLLIFNKKKYHYIKNKTGKFYVDSSQRKFESSNLNLFKFCGIRIYFPMK